MNIFFTFPSDPLISYSVHSVSSGCEAEQNMERWKINIVAKVIQDNN
jgi:hypothetical protein